MRVASRPGAGRCAMLALAAIALAAAAGAARAEPGYPERPIRLVVPFTARGTSDVVARILADRLESLLGRTVVVDNRPGAGGTIGAAIVAQANADGYTLLYAPKSVAINASLYRDLPYDAARDFAAVGLVQETPYVFVVHHKLPAASMKELVALARAQPGKLNYASGGTGTGPQMAMELLKLRLGLDLVHVPYKGSAPALRDVAAGFVQVQCASLIAALQFLPTGRLRALALSTARRSPRLPEVPTMTEAGIPDYDESGWSGILAPAGTPKAIVEALNSALVRALRDPAVVRSMENEGAAPRPSTAAEHAARLAAEIRKWAEVVRRTGLRAN